MRSTDEAEHEYWIGRIKQIDRLLEHTVPTLVRVAKWSEEESRGSMPLFVSESEAAPKKKYILVHAICSSTIQRLYRVHRRFGWLKKEDGEVLMKLAKTMPRLLIPRHAKSPNRKKLTFVWQTGADLFGALNALTCSEMFWSFIRAGERLAHSSTGFLAFFGMLWALGRRYPDKNEAGAALEPSGPTATTTAKCLIAIHSLLDALRKRGDHYKRASALVKEIDAVAGKKGPYATWNFAYKLDLLAGSLFELSPYTIIEDEFVEAGKFLLEQTRKLKPDSDTSDAWLAARARIKKLLQKLDAQQKVVFSDSRLVVAFLLPAIVQCLRPGGNHKALRKYCSNLKPDEAPAAYWRDHASAAANAKTLCQKSLDRLQKPFAAFTKLAPPGPPSARTLSRLLLDVGESNHELAVTIDQSVAEPVAWCRRVINEETARASAGNLTDFDPAGLIGAITIAQKWNSITRPEAEDAIGRALAGALEDGSWMRGQPMYLESRVMGIWPHTPDIVWFLAVAVNSAPSMRVADEKLLAFVDWLERTKTRFKSPDPKIGSDVVEGWSSELDRIPNIIDFWNTAVSINALLEIREIAEMRLWQICTQRFTVITSRRKLEQVAPVDLGAMHGMRLHRRLMSMARLTELQDKYKEQDYALVLHGPPGSSKTVIVEGIGMAMWKGVSERERMRLVRITPSDFTRQGEERLDSEARLIFELLSHVRGVTILFDEIDDFLRQRIGDEKPSFIQLITPAMLNRLQDLRDAAPRQEICFVIATNFVDRIEPALLREGRIDSVIPVSYPDAWSRHAILEQNLEGARISRAYIEEILKRTVGWPWSTYNKLTKEIAKIGKRLTDSLLEEQLKRFSGDVQTSDYYYGNPERWERYSPHLANEYVHLSFCKSKDLTQCEEMVEQLVGELSTKPPIADVFKFQVAEEGRS